jgi:nicotinic acid mononucleotide adenylyltransferase
LELSSSDVRRALTNRSSISEMVPSAVEKYITDNHLYV